MIPAHRIDAILVENGKLSLDNLPFRAGQAVNVIVLPVATSPVADRPNRGMVICFDRPTDPATEFDGPSAPLFESEEMPMTVQTPGVEPSEKQLAYRALERMPETVTLEQISEELAILAAIRRGERAADEGRVVSHEEVARRSASWTGK